MAGIRHKQVQLSSMVGYTLPHRALPHSGFGHVFVDGPSPVLAYELATGETRLMFDIAKPEDWQPCLDALPLSLRRDFEAVKDETPLRAANYSIIPESVTKGRMVCVGDAGGCCHPLTATGLSACTRDALLLRQALRETSAEIPKALKRYARLRQVPQSTRLIGAKVLYDVLRAQSHEMRLLRQGLFQYWQTPRGRRKTVALLSTHEVRRSVLIREYLQVCKCALPGLLYSCPARGHTVVGLSRALLRFVGEAYLGCK
jgi:2-polyprenyl-6-methoxyphenol hydroxylase-like FAD-dependent oxidoreductase